MATPKSSSSSYRTMGVSRSQKASSELGVPKFEETTVYMVVSSDMNGRLMVALIRTINILNVMV